jgi:hypothetical protein
MYVRTTAPELTPLPGSRAETLRPELREQLQPSFQPAASEETAKRRFLAWNMTGTVTSRDEDSHHSIYIVCGRAVALIHITMAMACIWKWDVTLGMGCTWGMQEFADSMLHSNMNIRDDYGYTVAALNDRAVVLSNPAGDGVKATVCEEPWCMQPRSAACIHLSIHGTHVYVILHWQVHLKHFDSWAVNSDWTVELPDGESPVCLAIGDRWAAVATTKVRPFFERKFRRRQKEPQCARTAMIPCPGVALDGDLNVDSDTEQLEGLLEHGPPNAHPNDPETGRHGRAQFEARAVRPPCVAARRPGPHADRD